MKRILIPAVCAAALLILTACTAVTESPTPTTSLSPTAAATVTPLPTATVTPIPTTYTHTPQHAEVPETGTTYPTPDFFSSNIASNVFFPPDSSSDCQPPCWQDLHIGESNKDDIQAMFDDVFGFNGTRNFFEDALELEPIWVSNAPGMQTDGYRWETAEGGYFAIATVIDSNDNILQGIRFIYGAFDVYDLHTPQQVISRLGTPDQYFTMNIANPSNLAVGDKVVITIAMFYYNEGLALHLATPIFVQAQESTNEKVIQYCLNSAPSVGMSYIVEPFESLNPDDLNPLQEDWFSVYYTHWNIGSEELGLTPEEFAEVAFQDPPCIDLK